MSRKILITMTIVCIKLQFWLRIDKEHELREEKNV